ncbi:MAG TPA: hypothetical protein VIV60_30330 [Polyangiaceae bacterium]
MFEREKSCVRLFISVDLVGSTAFKSKAEMSASNFKAGPPWVDVFRLFYAGFPRTFERAIGNERLPERLRPRLVKAIGDELLLVAPLQSSEDARMLIPFVAAAAREYSERNLEKDALSLKAAAWIAGFPIINHKFDLLGETGVESADYIGPSMDTGFRIAKFATAQKLVVSVDLALLLLTGHRKLDLYFDGTQSLKGVLAERPYPVLWYKASRENDALHKAEISLRRLKVDSDALKAYCAAFIDDCTDTWLSRPYFEDDPDFFEKPRRHEQILAEWARIDKKLAADEPDDSLDEFE